MWVIPGPVLGILTMALCLGTRSYIWTRALTTSSSVSNKAQNKLGESTHTIGSNILMHMIMKSS